VFPLTRYKTRKSSILIDELKAFDNASPRISIKQIGKASKKIKVLLLLNACLISLMAMLNVFTSLETSFFFLNLE
jgi:hypothetical protein